MIASKFSVAQNFAEFQQIFSKFERAVKILPVIESIILLMEMDDRSISISEQMISILKTGYKDPQCDMLFRAFLNLDSIGNLADRGITSMQQILLRDDGYNQQAPANADSNNLKIINDNLYTDELVSLLLSFVVNPTKCFAIQQNVDNFIAYVATEKDLSVVYHKINQIKLVISKIEGLDSACSAVELVSYINHIKQIMPALKLCSENQPEIMYYKIMYAPVMLKTIPADMLDLSRNEIEAVMKAYSMVDITQSLYSQRRSPSQDSQSRTDKIADWIKATPADELHLFVDKIEIVMFTWSTDAAPIIKSIPDKQFELFISAIKKEMLQYPSMVPKIMKAIPAHHRELVMNHPDLEKVMLRHSESQSNQHMSSITKFHIGNLAESVLVYPIFRCAHKIIADPDANITLRSCYEEQFAIPVLVKTALYHISYYGVDVFLPKESLAMKSTYAKVIYPINLKNPFFGCEI